MGKNNEGMSEYLYLLPFLPVVVYAIIAIWYNPYHLIDNGGTKAMGIAMVLQIGVSLLVAMITGIFSVYAVKSQRRYRRLEEALGNILEKGTLTGQHNQMEQTLTGQHKRIDQTLREQHNQMEQTLTGQHNQMKQTLTGQHSRMAETLAGQHNQMEKNLEGQHKRIEQSLEQITGNTGEYGNLTAQHNRISKEVEGLVQRAEAMDHRNATLSQDAKKISESITVLVAFQELLGRQSEELAERNLEIQKLKEEIRLLRTDLTPEKERINQRKGKSR